MLLNSAGFAHSCVSGLRLPESRPGVPKLSNGLLKTAPIFSNSRIMPHYIYIYFTAKLSCSVLYIMKLGYLAEQVMLEGSERFLSFAAACVPCGVPCMVEVWKRGSILKTKVPDCARENCYFKMMVAVGKRT